MFRIRTARPLSSAKTSIRSPTWAGRSIRVFSSCATRFDATDFLNHIGPTLDRRHLAFREKAFAGIGSRTSPTAGLPACPTRSLVQDLLCFEIPAMLQPRPSRLAPSTLMRHHHGITSIFSPHSCLPLLSRRVNKLMVGCPLMADELQNRVMLEKLKSRSVIAGTRSLPVSDVIASAGFVKAAIRLKTRRGLS
jgi:hypothetical protein